MYVRYFDLKKEPSPDPDETPGTISFTAQRSCPVLQVAVEADEKDAKGTDVMTTDGLLVEKSAAKTVVQSPLTPRPLPAISAENSSGEDARGASSSAGLKGNSQSPAPEETIYSSSTQLPDVAVHAPLGTRTIAQRIVANIVASRRVASRDKDEKHG
ncbi:hypothetical protein ABZP36_033895 [Zizania latifolia]